MCSGLRSSSANGAIALRHSAARSWSTSSSRVLSLCTIRGPSFTARVYGGLHAGIAAVTVASSASSAAFCRARYAATLAREEQRSEQ